MRLPPAPEKWTVEYQTLVNAELERLDRESRKTGQDVVVSSYDDVRTERLILPSVEGWGIQVDPTSPVYPWRDLFGHIEPKTGGNSPPVNTVYVDGIYQYSFGTSSPEKEIFIEYHLPHDYLPASDIFSEIHWSVAAASTGNVHWAYDVVFAKGYNQAPFEGTAGSGEPITVCAAQASPTAFNHQMAGVQISAPGGLIAPAEIDVSITSGAATVTAASALFTAADIGRTVTILGAGAAAADLETIITAFSSTTSITVADNASTTVTTTDAFRYRVLDSGSLETSGLLLARLSRQTTRTADTLDQAPFLHAINIHYQSTNIGTKGRDGPDFWS